MVARTIEVRHPFAEPRRVDERKYRAIRDALLRVIPADRRGIPHRTLTPAVQRQVSARTFSPAEVGHWVTLVTLDLIARGIVEEVGGEGPHRVRRKTTAPRAEGTHHRGPPR